MGRTEGGRLIRKPRDTVGWDQSSSAGGDKTGSNFKRILNLLLDYSYEKKRSH